MPVATFEFANRVGVELARRLEALLAPVAEARRHGVPP